MRGKGFRIFVCWLGVLVGLAGISRAMAQAPETLPYTINRFAGGGTVCSTAADKFGDGCPVTQAVLGNNLVGIAADPRGNLYVLDTVNNLLRRIDASTGIITVAAGSSSSSSICSAAADRYGDGCPASDGLANATSGHTYLGKPYAIAISHSGDIYISAGISLVQKISASTGIMTRVAGVLTTPDKSGTVVSGYSGDGGPATSAELNGPRGIALSPSDDLYIADYTNNVIRVVYNGGVPAAAQIIAANPSVTSPVIGNIYTIAGDHGGAKGTTGDGGYAAAALLTNPSDVAVDAHGNVYIVDQSKDVRMIYAGGTVMGLTSPTVGYIYRVAGGGSVKGDTPTVIQGTTATMSTVRRLVFDVHGNLYISDSNFIIWFVDGSTGWMRPIAGVYNGSTNPVGCPEQTDSVGDGCPATSASLQFPSGDQGYGMAVDANGNLYIGDPVESTIRKVSPNTFFPATTPATPLSQTIELHYAAGAAFSTLAFDNADYTAGTPSCAVNGDNTQDCFVSVTFTPSIPGADNSALHTVDTLSSTGTIGFVGTSIVPSLALDPGVVTQIGSSQSKPAHLASDGHGNVYIADTGNHRVLRYNIASQTQTVIAGTGTAGYSGDGSAATAATLSSPGDVAVAPDGTLYIADTGNNVIRRVDAASGIISTYAGGASTVCSAATDTFGDGCPATQSTLSTPSGLAIAPDGMLYIADTGNARIRSVPPNQGVAQTVVGGAATVCSAATDTVGDGCSPLQVTLSAPHALRFDTAGNLYIADTGNNLIRRVSLPVSGQPVTAIAGNGQAGGSGDGGPAASAQLSAPSAIALDGAGNVYVADTGNHAIRFVSASSGVIITVVGFNGTSGNGTLPSAATSLLLDLPAGVEAAGASGLYVADTANGRTLSIDRTSVAFDFGKINISGSSTAQAVTVTSTGSTLVALGTPYVTSSGNTAQLTLTSATTNGCSAAESLALGESCSLVAQFAPASVGAVSAAYNFAGTTAANTPVPSIALTGAGAILVGTATTLSQATPASGNPEYGQDTIFTVTVTPANQGASTISGAVTLSIDGVAQSPVALTATSANGSATLALPRLSVGTHTLIASYSGDDLYGKSSSTAYTLTVTQSQSSVAITASPTATTQFQSVTFSATVSAVTGGVPTGTVSFSANGKVIGQGTLDPTGLAIFTTTSLDVASYQIVATYSGDTNFTQASSSLTFVVSADPPDFTLSPGVSTLKVAQGGSIQTTFTFTPTNTLNGNVRFGCAGLPANAACTFMPSVFSVTSGSLQAQTVTLTIWTNVNSVTLPSQSSLSATRTLEIASLAPLAPLALLAFVRRRRILRCFALACVAVLFASALTGCGKSQAIDPVVTPAGTSTISITGTGPDAQSHTFTVGLTVTSAS